MLFTTRRQDTEALEILEDEEITRNKTGMAEGLKFSIYNKFSSPGLINSLSYPLWFSIVQKMFYPKGSDILRKQV